MMPEEQPILFRISNRVEAMQKANMFIRETIGRLNRSIGDEMEAAKKLEPIPKKDPGEFEMLEALINEVASEIELNLKALNRFADRTIGPSKAQKP